MFYCLITLPSFHVWLWQLRDGLPKKGVVLLDFVQMRGGGPCPNFLSTFHKLYILGQFGDGEGGGDPWPNFLADWRSKKVVRVVQIRGTGGRRKFGQNPKEQLLFFGRPSLIWEMRNLYILHDRLHKLKGATGGLTLKLKDSKAYFFSGNNHIFRFL